MRNGTYLLMFIGRIYNNNSFLIMIFRKQPLHYPTSQQGHLAMFLYMNIELVNELSERKYLTLGCLKVTKMSLCLFAVGNKNVTLPAKGLIFKLKIAFNYIKM